MSPNTTYHYRVKGVNAVGTVYGLDKTFTTTIGTNLDYKNVDSLVLYPNPATHGFYIENADNGDNIFVIDLTGRILITKQIVNKTFIDISSLPMGVYIVKINDSSTKLFKTK